jgi:aspartyl-tRNA(Asn)/glutamyl-tRNA(Gln) amidotransferase subunit B
MVYESVIGLEIHAQLRTRTKIFCGCSTVFGAAPNSQVCPVCLGLPGALPVLNRRAVDLAIKAGLALECAVQPESVFARKNYFYPDLPKGYQISQFERPLALGGRLEILSSDVPRWISLTRIHMEEDAGKSTHDGVAESVTKTHVDYNRSGVPLIEIVSEPDMRSANEAVEFFSRLRDILAWLDVSDGNMEEGSLRCDANVSLRPVATTALGTKVEVKNLNSFRYLKKAIEYEIDRQAKLLDGGGRVVQETRLWDVSAGRTQSMRSKEEAQDYRYFPEPDLPPLVVAAERVEALRATMPELPVARRHRFVQAYGLPEYDAGVLTHSVDLANYFEDTARASGNPKAASNWVMGEVSRALNERAETATNLPVTPGALAELIGLIDTGILSSSTAKDVFGKMLDSSRSALEIVEAHGLAQLGDESALRAIVARVVDNQATAVAQYRAGKTATFGFLVGQAMKASQGKANPKIVSALLREALDRGTAENEL